MSITRRALLGTLVGLPLGVKAAMGKSPMIGDINVTAQPGFSQQRIEDIGDAFLTELERRLIFQEFRYTDKVKVEDCHTVGFRITTKDSILRIKNMVRIFVYPAIPPVVDAVRRYHDCKYRHVGVAIEQKLTGDLFVRLMISQMEEKPAITGAAYSKWQRAM